MILPRPIPRLSYDELESVIINRCPPGTLFEFCHLPTKGGDGRVLMKIEDFVVHSYLARLKRPPKSDHRVNKFGLMEFVCNTSWINNHRCSMI